MTVYTRGGAWRVASANDAALRASSFTIAAGVRVYSIVALRWRVLSAGADHSRSPRYRVRVVEDAVTSARCCAISLPRGVQADRR